MGAQPAEMFDTSARIFKGDVEERQNRAELPLLEGAAIIYGDLVRFVLVPPGGDIWEPYSDEPRLDYDMGRGFRLVFVNFGTSPEVAAGIKKRFGIEGDPAERDWGVRKGGAR